MTPSDDTETEIDASPGIEAVRDVMGHVEDVDMPDSVGEPPPDPAPREAGPPDDPPAEEDPPERQCANFPLNDVGNGKRFVVHFGGQLLFVGRVGWHVWDGTRWAADDEIAKGVPPRTRALAQQLGPLIEKETRWIALTDQQVMAREEKRNLEAQSRALYATPPDHRDEAWDEQLSRLLAGLTRVGKLLKPIDALISTRLTFAKDVGNSGRIDKFTSESSISLNVPLDQMDAQPLAVNTRSKTLVFSVDPGDPDSGASAVARVEVKDHDRADFITKRCDLDFDPDARCDAFTTFLLRILPDGDVRRCVQRWLGYSMLGLKSQHLSYWFGDGANGKSVLMTVITKVLGDYAAKAKIESLIGEDGRKPSDATPDLIPLVGSRFATASEPKGGVQWNEAMIKILTGGDSMQMRRNFGDSFETVPDFKLTIAGNVEPEIRGTDWGIWRRLLLVPFTVQIPEEERVNFDDMVSRLVEEAPGIFNWLVEGALAFLEEGLNVPASMTLARDHLREASDPVGEFINDCCNVTGHPDDSVLSRDMVERFQFWLMDRGEGVWKDRTIFKALKDHSRAWRAKNGQKFTEHKSAGLMRYTGVLVLPAFDARFREAPRDSQGRLKRGTAGSGTGDGGRCDDLNPCRPS